MRCWYIVAKCINIFSCFFCVCYHTGQAICINWGSRTAHRKADSPPEVGYASVCHPSSCGDLMCTFCCIHSRVICNWFFLCICFCSSRIYHRKAYQWISGTEIWTRWSCYSFAVFCKSMGSCVSWISDNGFCNSGMALHSTSTIVVMGTTSSGIP